MTPNSWCSSWPGCSADRARRKLEQHRAERLLPGEPPRRQTLARGLQERAGRNFLLHHQTGKKASSLLLMMMTTMLLLLSLLQLKRLAISYLHFAVG